MRRSFAGTVVVAVLVSACASGNDASTPRTSEATETSSTSAVPDSDPGTPATTPVEPSETLDRSVIGASVQGRSIEVWHRTDLPGAGLAIDDPRRVVVLVIGSIHGNEPAGLGIVDVLAAMPEGDVVQVLNASGADLASNLDLWLMPTGNPDGIAAGTRHNARRVDLNRNFPVDWAPLQAPGDYEYSGSGPASEPETRAMMDFLERLRPDLTVWFHQDAYRVAPSQRSDRDVRALYAYLTGLPLLAVEGGTYTGVAATWHRRTFGDVSFIVELGSTVSSHEELMHARAVLAVTFALDRP